MPLAESHRASEMHPEPRCRAHVHYRHLRELQAAGLTHVHLLPAYDFATVPERAEDQLDVEVGAIRS